MLEDVWRGAPASQKKHLQGLVQIAVALHHYTRGNLVGAGSVLARAQQNLRNVPEGFAGLDMAALQQALAACAKELASGTTIEVLPKISRLKRGRRGG